MSYFFDMRISFYSYNKKNWFLLYILYFFLIVVIFKVFGLHVSTLGDYRLYGRGSLDMALSPETITINIYTILSYVGLSPTILGSLIFIYFAYLFTQNMPQTSGNVFIFFSIFNPFCLQFIIYPSKETLLVGFTLFFLTRKNFKFTDPFILLLILLIRPNYFIVVVVAAVFLNGTFLRFNAKKLAIFVSLFGLLILVYIEVNGYTSSIISIIRQSFLPYSQSTTNRYWVPIIESLVSVDFVLWFSIGLYTIFFGLMKLKLAALPIILAGFGKILMFTKIFRRKYIVGYLWLIATSVYAVPLSVYNVGSSLRYSIPLLLIIFFTLVKYQEKKNECR